MLGHLSSVLLTQLCTHEVHDLVVLEVELKGLWKVPEWEGIAQELGLLGAGLNSKNAAYVSIHVL